MGNVEGLRANQDDILPMIRSAAIIAAIGLLAGSSSFASAQAPGSAKGAHQHPGQHPGLNASQTANQTECPIGPVSIYFAAGDVTPSPQSRAVLDKICEAADTCAADQIEVVAHVDTGEGEGALRFALKRLQLVSDQLVALGLPAARIRTATDAPDVDQRTDVGRRQIDILFGRAVDATPPDDANGRRLQPEPPIPTIWI